MAINFRSNTVIKNLRIGPLSGGGNGGGGGSSEPSYLVVGAQGASDYSGAAYVYDATNYSATPTKLAPSGLQAYDRFGQSVASNGNQIIVGANSDDDQANGAGAVYVYDATNLSTTPTKLAPSDLAVDSYFGWSVAATPNQIIVGANQASAVYVYDATNLSATPTKLAPSGLDATDKFGEAVAVSSNQIVVGVPFIDDVQGDNAGAVYVYDATNLSATPTILAPSELETGDNFGFSVAVTSNHIVVGARFDDDQANGAGAVYVYDATNLSATPTKLTPSGLDANDAFGFSIAATSNYIVVGAPYDADQGTNAGAVYVYDATNLSAAPTKLAPTDSGLGDSDYSGISVTVNGNQIVVGATNDEVTGSNTGAVYVYDATNLSATPTKLAPSDLGPNHQFGESVSLG